MKRNVYIKLKANTSGIGADYRVDKLRNAAEVYVTISGRPAKKFRIGDEVTHAEADLLCEVSYYDVTIEM